MYLRMEIEEEAGSVRGGGPADVRGGHACWVNGEGAFLGIRHIAWADERDLSILDMTHV